uniref:TLC domain-containing protein n=1 Tax=Anopheles farauti TaxID=69004 RepID=A0A182Q6X6_9DIPT
MAEMVLLQLRALRSWLVQGDRTMRDTLNSIFWLSCLFGLVFVQFRRMLQGLFRLGRIKRSQYGRLVQHLWSICFHTSATIFLLLYQLLLIRPEVMRESGKYFPQYHNAIFATACDPAKFELVTIVLVAFQVCSTFGSLAGCDYSVAFSSTLHGVLLLCGFGMRLENYSILLNLYIALYCVFREGLLMYASQMDQTSQRKLIFVVVLKCCTWSYLFLYLLSFEFLIPTLYARRQLFPLKLCFWLWYCSCVWNSPLLKLLYHKIYHTHPNDCEGGESAARCILSTDWQTFRYMRTLQQAYLELKKHESRGRPRVSLTSESPARTAFQTIKCMVAMKRKAKRLREGKEQRLLQAKQQ